MLQHSKLAIPPAVHQQVEHAVWVVMRVHVMNVLEHLRYGRDE